MTSSSSLIVSLASASLSTQRPTVMVGKLWLMVGVNVSVREVGSGVGDGGGRPLAVRVRLELDGAAGLFVVGD